MRYMIKEGNYIQMGAVRFDSGVTFTFEGKKEAKCAILLYRIKSEEIIRIEVPREYCIGSLRSVFVEKLDIGKYRYNYEINGIVIVDPYAKRIEGRERWNEASRWSETYQISGGFVEEDYDWEGDTTPEIPKEDMVMYKLHARGYTMDGGVKGKKRGTFAGLQEKIPYLKSLGITTVELMPVNEFEELVIPEKDTLPDYLTWKIKGERKAKNAPEEIQPKIEKVNFWGYVPGNYFAPKTAYASSKDAVKEFKDFIKELHRNTMECIMEVYFDASMNQNLMLDTLRYWVMRYHIDGFHLLGFSIPIRAMAQDLVLNRTKLFSSGFDEDLTEDKTKYPHLYVYNDEYLYPLRKMLNHMDGNLYEFVSQQKKQHEVLGYVNYAAINNSFALADVFMYSEKHNMDNGENNADGLNFNFSNNYGVEGASRKKYIKEIRGRQAKNALAMVCLAQGIPLIASGDEFGNSQNGNNNSYCQDNRIGWVNWRGAVYHTELTEFLKDLLTFRRSHPVIHLGKPVKMNDYKGIGYPDLSYHCEIPWVVGFEPSRQSVGIMYCGRYAGEAEAKGHDFVYIAYNFHNGKQFLALPKLPKGEKWALLMDTALNRPFLKEELLLEKQDMIEIAGMSIRILVGGAAK